MLGEYQKAVDVYPPIPLSSRGATCTDQLLSLKLQTGEHIAGRDVLTLNGPKVTSWGKNQLDKVAFYLDIILGALENHNNCNLLEIWKKSSHQYPYSVYRGTPQSSTAGIQSYAFSQNREVMEFVKEKTSDAENSVREEMNIPHVGKGWIGETELYYSVRDALPGIQVIQHVRPSWLGRQHLDVFIPDYRIAFEFQGTQHDQPVEYFGGEEAYFATKKRDAIKKRKCTQNGVLLIEVHPGYELAELIRIIHRHVKEVECTKSFE